MQDSDTADFSVETLQEQFVKVRTLTTQSPVEEYGDMSLSSDTLSQYQGAGSNPSAVPDSDTTQNWDSHLVKLQFLQNLAQAVPSQENQQAFAQEQAFHAQTSNNFYSFSLSLDPANQFQLMTAQRQVQDFQCLRGAVAAYEANCGTLGEFGLKFVQVLVNACESGFLQTAISAALSQSCSQVLYE
jgi:legumain